MRTALARGPLLLSLFVATFAPISAFSQNTASLRGTITDPTGAVIPGVSVSIRGADTGTVRSSTTDAQGAYSFLQVPPGTYKLVAEKPGFSTMAKGDVKLLVNTPITLDLSMSLGSIGEVVNVA